MAKNQIVMDALEAFNKWYLGRVHDDDREESLRAFLAGFQACAALRPTPREADDLPVCLCPSDGMPFFACPIHGAAATGRGLR